MIEIDGSLGEGGGQVLRTSIALSALTGEPIRVFNIRAKRSNPGLRPQHIMGIKALSRLSNAEVSGLKQGSMEITFKPSAVKGGAFEVNIGTAGSITLVLQALMPAAAVAYKPVELRIIGGTDVAWSPPIDYLINVTLPTLRKMGYKCNINVIRRGYYPRGGGVVKVEISPVKKFVPLNEVEREEIKGIYGVSHCGLLPQHVCERQAKSAIQALKSLKVDKIDVKLDYLEGERKSLCPGSGIVLWADCGNTVLGADSLGERGKPAETVGKEAAEKLSSSLSTGKAFDPHMGDMLIPYIAMADGTSEIGVAELTLHALTNIQVTEQILGVKFYITGSLGEPAIIKVKGVNIMKK
ncbi:MAG: RNA 3'-terminal phosphate cyclase [Candidatus Odinarchaeia archaeon]